MPEQAPYTHRNIEDVKDMAPDFGLSGMGEARFATQDLESTEAGFSHHRLAPGARQPFAHRHEKAEEVYVVIGGSGRVKLDDEIVELGRLDAIRVSPEVTRNFEASEDGLEILAFGRRYEGDGEVIPGWWSEEEG